MFIILTAPRTGSELLTEALSNHPDLRVKSEILNPHRYQDWRDRILIEMNASALNYTAYIDRSIPISKIIYDQDQKLVEFIDGAFKHLDGFKITYDQITQDSPVVSYFQKLEALQIIFLHRNYLESAISYWFAIKSQIWQAERHRPEIVDEPQKVDYNFVKNFYQLASQNNTYYHNIFSNHKHIDIEYTHLTNQFQSTLARIQGFLDVDVEISEPRFQKRLNRPLPELVTNYQELINGPWVNLPCLS